MKDNIRQILIISVLVLGMYSWIIGTVGAAEPTVVEIDYDPQNPEVASTVTFNATINGEDVSAVHIIVQECNEQVCFIRHNISMNKVDTSEYQIDVELTRDDASIVKYNLKIESDGVWYDFKDDIKQFNLVPKTNGDQTNGNDNTNGTPGFELIPIVVSIVFVLFIHKIKESDQNEIKS